MKDFRFIKNEEIFELEEPGSPVTLPRPDQFMGAWEYCGYPSISVGHRLAASLAMTQPALADLQMPWICFEVFCPSRVLGPNEYSILVLSGHDGSVSLTGFEGLTQRWIGTAESIAKYALDLEVGLKDSNDEQHRSLQCFFALAVGATRELERVRKNNNGIGHASYQARGGMAPTEPRHYALTRPVELDVREELRQYLRGGGCPHSVQSMVRGHHKRQPHGKSGQHRRWIQIEPYFRGQRDAPMAFRPHNL